MGPVLPLADVDFREKNPFLKPMVGKPRTCTTDSAAKCAPYDWLMNGRGIDLNSGQSHELQQKTSSEFPTVQKFSHGFQGLVEENRWKTGLFWKLVHLATVFCPEEYSANHVKTSSFEQLNGAAFLTLFSKLLMTSKAVGNYNVATCKVGKNPGFRGFQKWHLVFLPIHERHPLVGGSR